MIDVLRPVAAFDSECFLLFRKSKRIELDVNKKDGTFEALAILFSMVTQSQKEMPRSSQPLPKGKISLVFQDHSESNDRSCVKKMRNRLSSWVFLYLLHHYMYGTPNSINLELFLHPPTTSFRFLILHATSTR